MNSEIGKKGKASKRIEDDRLLRGKGRFVDNLNLPDQVYLHVLRSSFGHAEILGIDFEEASEMPGVVAIFTAEDLEKDGIGSIPLTLSYQRSNGEKAFSEPYHALASKRVRFIGQPVAMVLAESKAQALEAVEQIEVEYEEWTAVTEPEDALLPEAPLLCEQLPNNIAAEGTYGNQEKTNKAFAEAHHISSMEIVNNRVVGNPLEPRGLLCDINDQTGKRTLHTSHQSVSRLQATLCSIFQIEHSELRIRVRDMGGGFGTKIAVYPEDVLVVYAAQKLKRPVKWTATRSEEFLATVHGRDQKSFAELACSKEGKILGLRLKTIVNTGAFLNNPALLIPLTMMPKVLTSMYHVPSVFMETCCVLTNTAPLGAYRGAGRPEGIYPIERLMDLAAREMSLDPVSFRKQNMIAAENMPHTTYLGEVIDSGDFAAVLDQALEKLDWTGFQNRKTESEKQGLFRGRGLSCFIEWTGGELSETVTIEATGNGCINLYSGTQAMGQGLETVFTQLLSDELQIPMSSIHVIQGDTNKIKGLGSFGSRSLFLGGSALVEGVAGFLEKGKKLASEVLNLDFDQIIYKSGCFQSKEGAEKIKLSELANEQQDQRFSKQTEIKLDGRSWPNGCQIAEVEIDPETGNVQLVRYGCVNDAGNLMNPMIVEGQVHGGIAQGAGQALMENALYDEQGQLLSGSFLDYAMPRATDLPNFQCFTLPHAPCKTNPLGAKGVGEIGVVGSLPAISNAILDALWSEGVREFNMPAHPQKIWTLLQQAKADK